MNNPSPKYKIKGILFSSIFHLLFIISLFYFGLSYQIPPPEEKGISINFGFNSMKKIDDVDEVEVLPEIKKNSISNIITPPDNSVISQSTLETIKVNKVNKKAKEPISEEQIVEKEVEAVKEKTEDSEKEDSEDLETKNEVIEKKIINPKALFSKKNKANKSVDENKSFFGSEIDIKNNESYQNGDDGISFNLNGRNISTRVIPNYDIQEEGIVVVLISVNRNGLVTNAITGAKGSTTFNSTLLQKAKKAALKTKFSINSKAPVSQQGKIIYNFKLN